jgi:branched-chain amino acid aminotransferase
MHRFFLHNDEILEASARTLSAGQVGLLSGWGVFSTLRVNDGVPFEWQRHWERMKRDAAHVRVPFPSESKWLEERVHRLIDANRAWNSTLRVYVIRNRGGLYEGPGQTRDFDVIGFTVDVVAWPESVKLDLAANGRHAANEFAGTKYISWAENLTRYERAHDAGFDEVILLNERGEVSECTSANVFVVNGSRVWTPPLAAGCLAGVTRAVLLEEIAVPGLDIEEKTLTPDDLEIADEVLITSSTRGLLPAASIRGLQIPGGRTVCDTLCQEFAKYVAQYTAAHRRPVPVSE